MRHHRERRPALPPSNHICNEKGGQGFLSTHRSQKRNYFKHFHRWQRGSNWSWHKKSPEHPDRAVQKLSGMLRTGSRALSSFPAECQCFRVGEWEIKENDFKSFLRLRRSTKSSWKKLEAQAVNPYKRSSHHFASKRTFWKPAGQVCVDKCVLLSVCRQHHFRHSLKARDPDKTSEQGKLFENKASRNTQTLIKCSYQYPVLNMNHRMRL